MKQYCRYCSYCHYGDVAYCEKLNKTMSDEKAKRINRCKYFDFLEIDVFNPDNTYKERPKKIKDNQMNIFEIDKELEQWHQKKDWNA